MGEEAIVSLFELRFHAYMLGSERVYAMMRDIKVQVFAL